MQCAASRLPHWHVLLSSRGLVLRSRLWWKEVVPDDWHVFGMSDGLVKERYLALLAALEELSTRGPMATLSDITTQLKTVGYHDPLPEAELRERLDQLEHWGFAEPFRDYAAPLRTLQGLSAREETWALTRRGRGIVAAVRSAVVDMVRALQLPSRLLDQVTDTLREILDHLKNDHGRLPGDLEDVRTRIDELQRVTADFYAALAKMVQSDVTDDDVFGENRDRVVEALRQFPREYGRGLPRVEAALAELRTAGLARTVEAAAEHAGLLNAADQQHWIDERVRRLADLEAWFKPDGTVHRLIDSASGAVHTLLVAIDRRYMARRRGSDLGVDFRGLAHSLHRQPDDTEARRVYAAAFGDWPSWHAVTGTGEEDVAHGTPTRAGGSRYQVEVTLREHERHGTSTGRPRKVPDTNELFAQLHTWQDSAPHLGPLPKELTDPALSDERTDTGQLITWLSTTAASARARIDLAGHQARATADAALARAATATAEQARHRHTAAQTTTDKAAAAHQAALRQAQAETQADEARQTQAHHDHHETRSRAQAALDAAEQALAEADTTVLRTIRHWLGLVHTWRAAWSTSPPTTSPCPTPPQPQPT
jgi:uncharacterized protein (TIGR02677 family)